VLRRLAWSVLAPLVAGTALAQPLPDEISACLSDLDAAQASGDYDDDVPTVGQVCPDFYAAITESTWADTMPADEVYYLDRAGLTTLITLAAGYETAPATAVATEPLDAIVAELQPFVPDEQPSLWQRFGDWIEGLFESESGEENWLSRWLNSFSFSEAASYTLVRIIAIGAVIAVLAILINELRLGGAFVRGQRRTRRFAPASGPGVRAQNITLDAVMQAPSVRRKVELMLGLVVNRLQRQHAELVHAGRTHRELAAAADQLNAHLRDPFTDVVQAAERVTYGGWEPGEQELRQVLESGQAVIAIAGNEPDGRP
jgi:hypothetical protein